MSMEQNLLLLVWIIGFSIVTFLVPRGKWHFFITAFLICQGLAWLTETIMLECNIIAYPVREFPRASQLSITMETMLIPFIASLYVIFEPVHSRGARVRHFILWTVGFTLIDFLIAHYTKLQDHNRFYLWLAILIFGFKLSVVNVMVRWFFRDPAGFRRESSNV